MTGGYVSQELLRDIAEAEPRHNAFVHLDHAAFDVGEAGTGPLAGRAVAVKDNIAVRGAPWVCGSATRRADPPAERDAEVVRRLRSAGGVVIGTTNLDEFAMGASTESSVWGPTHNPWDIERSPGGSSGGSAAAVAAYGVLALGTDTGGSIREPASQCGVVGVKPSHGSIPLDAVVPFAPSFDAVGPMARTVAETALLHDVIAGLPGTMAAAADVGASSPSLADVTIGVIAQMSGERNAADVLAAFRRGYDALVERGAAIHDVSLARTGEGLQAYYTLSSVEALVVLESHALIGALGDEAAHRLETGRSLRDSEEWQGATLVRDMVAYDLATCFEHCDVLISPTMPLVAPRLGRVGVDDPLAIPRTDWWTVEANLAGLPALSLPCGIGPESGLPVGLQLLAPQGKDARLYRIAASLEVSKT